MSLIIDPPNAPGHGRMWSHLASDVSYEELHAFAERLGLPERAFDRDHYDIPEDWYDRVVAMGAEPIGSRELIERLRAAGLRRPKSESLLHRLPGHTLVRPPLLQSGDGVAVVSPAGPVDDGRLVRGLAVLRDWGLETVQEHHRGPADLPWLAGTDAERARALTEAWCDPEIRVVWCVRGGAGSQRVLDLLDWGVLRQARPSWLVGFSDITALHQAFAGQLGVVTLHAAGVAGLGAAATADLEALQNILFGGPTMTLTGRPGGGGSSRGVLVGGNVTVLAAGLGTPLVHPAHESIALLEDVNEQPYRLDRALTQLLRAGWFDGVRGIVCGSFANCGDPALVRKLLVDRIEPLGVPIVYEVPVGHGDRNHPMPLGLPAVIDGDAGTLSC